MASEIELLLEEIEDICASPNVEGFNIGFTAQPIKKRRSQYRSVDYRCLTLLADKMTREAALDMEEELQNLVCSWDKWREGDGHRRRSAGGADDSQKDEPTHGVYIAWW